MKRIKRTSLLTVMGLRSSHPSPIGICGLTQRKHVHDTRTIYQTNCR